MQARRLGVALYAAVGLVLIAACRPDGVADLPARTAPIADEAARSETASGAGSATTTAKPGDWPQWRGPNGDGISRETDWQAAWPGDGPPLLWSAEVGIGFSSVSVADGQLFTMGHQGNDDTVWCLDAATGQVRWKHSYACQLNDNLHEGGPAATPTIVGSRVFTVSKEGHLLCLDRASGQVQWQHEFPGLFDVDVPTWGFSCSPLAWGEFIIVEAGRTAAFRRETGELAWQTEKFRPGYGSPALFQPADEPLIAVLNNDVLLVVRPDDGSEVDKYPWETNFATNSTTPVCWQNTIFVSSGYDHGCALLQMTAGKLDCLWQNKEMRNHMANSVLWKQHLYGFDGNSNLGRVVQLKCLEHQTGKEVWTERGLGCGSLLIADGKLIALGDAGELLTAPATPDGLKPISRAQVIDGRCWTVPVLAQGRIYCRNAAGHLVALDVRKK